MCSSSIVCLGNTIVSSQLRAAGHRVEVYSAHFQTIDRQQEVSDSDWLREIGSRGWVVLSKDMNIAKNQIEVVALLESGVAAFFPRDGNLTGSAMAAAFLRAMPDIDRILRKFDRPFVATISEQGAVRIAYTKSDLIKEVP